MFVQIFKSWASLVAQLVKNLPAMRETWVGKIPWRRERPPTPVFWPGASQGLYSQWGHRESDTTERLSLSLGAHVGLPLESTNGSGATAPALP